MRLSALLLLGAAAVMAQQSNNDQDQPTCVSLRGSKQCPSFQDAWVNPQNLSRAWPWFNAVTDVETFDEQFDDYFRDPTRFHASKFNRRLQCNQTEARNATLQYQRTILCGQFSQIQYSAECNRQNNAKPVMVCQETCFQYSGSELSIVNNPQLCAANSTLTPTQLSARSATLRKDFVDCTDWKALTSADKSQCVMGIQNEGNCGWGPEVNFQLCQSCDPSGNKTVPSCCYESKTDLSQCAMFGHPLAATIKPTMGVSTNIGAQPSSLSSALPSSTSSSNGGAAATPAPTSMPDVGSDTGSITQSGLTGGQLAGILVGCIIGALLLGALLAFFLLGGRNRRQRDTEKATAVAGGGIGMSNLGAGAGAGSNNGHVYDNAEKTTGVTGASAWKASSDTGMRDTPDLGYKAPGSTSALGYHNSAGAPVDHQGFNDHQFSSGTAATAGAGIGALAAGAMAATAGRSQEEERPTSSLSNSTGTDGRGTTVPMVKDQYSGHEIHADDTVVAIYPYTASLNDELTLEPDDVITVVRLYDDGWALGRMVNGTSEGAFPMVCVTSSKGDAPRTSDDGGYTSQGTQNLTTTGSSVDGAVTADEGGFTSDARSALSAR